MPWDFCMQWQMTRDIDVREQRGNKVIGPFRHFRSMWDVFSPGVERKERQTQHSTAPVMPTAAAATRRRSSPDERRTQRVKGHEPRTATAAHRAGASAEANARTNIVKSRGSRIARTHASHTDHDDT